MKIPLVVMLFLVVATRGLKFANTDTLTTTVEIDTKTNDFGEKTSRCLFPILQIVTLFSMTTYFIVTDKFIGFSLPSVENNGWNDAYIWMHVVMILVSFVLCIFLFL